MQTNSTSTKKTAPTLDKAQLDGMSKCTGVSAQIRYLAAEGFDRGDIARITGKRYQHVRNVLITPLKRTA